MLSDNFDAQEALRLGLVNRVVPAASLIEETDKLARRLAEGPTFAYGKIKALLRGSSGRTLTDQMAVEADAFCDCAATPDFAEGVSAFLEKRPARFSGA